MMIPRRSLFAGASASLAAIALPTAAKAAGLPFLRDDKLLGSGKRGVIIRWGDGVDPSAPPFNPNHPDAEAAGLQFGWDGQLAGVVLPPPAANGTVNAIAIATHPTCLARMMFPEERDHPLVAARTQGASVVNLQENPRGWLKVEGGFQSRRLHIETLARISGPAVPAIGDVVQGILAPRGGSRTPWGTVLMGEGDPAPWLARLEGAIPRLATGAEATRFGWVIEFDPLDPTSIPAKRTALGRFPHEGIAVARAADGRAVVFLTDGRPMGYLFRFVAASAPEGDRTADANLLDAGRLEVAVIEKSGIRFAPLGADAPSVIAALDRAHQAGGSLFDWPAGLAATPAGTVYLACRGNPGRRAEEVNALNPRAGNGAGQVIAFHPEGGDAATERFAAELLLVGGNPAADLSARYGPGSSAWLVRPFALAADEKGRLWIGSDQGGSHSGTADGLFVVETEGRTKGALRAVYRAPIGAGLGGVGFLPGGTMLAMVRHPGAAPGADFADPATRWPTLDPAMPPQTTLVSLTLA